jgi:hypothetical protein
VNIALLREKPVWTERERRAVERAKELGFDGEALYAFIMLNKEERKNVLAAKWRLGGMTPAQADEAAGMDMTPLEHERWCRTRDDIDTRRLSREEQIQQARRSRGHHRSDYY